MTVSKVLGLVIAATIGCGPGGLEDGDSIPGCIECGPGALIDGRFFLGSGRFAANASGRAARALGFEGEIQFLGDGFSPGDRVAGLGLVSFTDWRMRVDPTGNVAALNEQGVVFIDARSASIRWEHPLDNARFIAMSDALVFVAAGLGPVVDLHAFRSDTGNAAWTRTIPPITSGVVTTDGGMILAGNFTGTLDLGGDTSPVSSATPAGWVAVLDAGGTARRITVATQGSDAQASISHVAGAANGNIALVGTWTGGPLSIGNFVLTAPPVDATGVFVSMLGSDGTVQWARAIGTTDRLEFAASDEPGLEVTSLLTDGVDMYISGTYWENTEGGFAARVTREATAWVSCLVGESDVDHLRLLALVEPDQIVAAFVWNLDRLAGGSDASHFTFGNRQTEVVTADTVHPGSVIGRLHR